MMASKDVLSLAMRLQVMGLSPHDAYRMVTTSSGCSEQQFGEQILNNVQINLPPERSSVRDFSRSIDSKLISDALRASVSHMLPQQVSCEVIQYLDSTRAWESMERKLGELLSDFYNATVMPIAQGVAQGMHTSSPQHAQQAWPANRFMDNFSDMSVNTQIPVRFGVQEAPHMVGNWPPEHAVPGVMQMHALQMTRQLDPGACVLPHSQASITTMLNESMGRGIPMSVPQMPGAFMYGPQFTQFEDLSVNLRQNILALIQMRTPIIQVTHFDNGVRYWLLQLQDRFGEVEASTALRSLAQSANLDGIRNMKAFITTRLIDTFEHLTWSLDPKRYALEKLPDSLFLVLSEVISDDDGACSPESNPDGSSSGDRSSNARTSENDAGSLEQMTGRQAGLKWSHLDPKVLLRLKTTKSLDAIRDRLHSLTAKELHDAKNKSAYIYSILCKKL